LDMDFRKVEPKIEFKNPAATVTGTRFGLILIDTNFEKKSRADVASLISSKEGDL
jgi:hypothetical protein